MVIVLIGDIGGTNARFQLLNFQQDTTLLKRDTLSTQIFFSFTSLLKQFLQNQPLPQKVVIGTAGLVQNNTVQFINSPWHPALINGDQIARQLNIDQLIFLNDFVVAGYGCLELQPDELIQVNPGIQKIHERVCVVIGPGTGLGECFMTWNGSSYDVWPGEGGAADFAPKTELQFKYVQYMEAKINQENGEFPQFQPAEGPCYQIGFAGIGVHHLYYFLKGEFPELVDQEFDQMFEMDLKNRAQLLMEYGFSKRNSLCEKAVEMWQEAMGYEVGNMIAKFLPYGGCFIAGGMFTKNALKILESGVFLEALNSKPPHIRDIIERVPIYIVKNLDVGLLGTRGYAKKLVN